MKVSVYVATSVDGFMAREDGSIDWLPVATDDGEGGDYGYGAFMASVDVLVMGRNTFETALGFGEWPYEGKPVVVLSSRPLNIPEALQNKVWWVAGAPADIVAWLEQQGFQHGYVDGGETIQGFLRAGLVNQLIVTRVPLLLGQGRPLFGGLPEDLRLKHVRTKSYPTGLVQSEYAL